MSAENVVPLNPEHARLRGEMLAFFDGLAERLRQNQISTVSVCGVDAAGEVFRYDVVPIGDDPTLRLLMLGLLTEAASEYTTPFNLCEDHQ